MKMEYISYDPMGPNIDLSVFNDNADWAEFYRDVEEELPPKMTKPHVMAVSIYSFVDANYVGNVVTRRFNNGIIMFIQNTPIIWFNNKQNMVKVDTLVSELVALRICKDFIVALMYKLRMFGFPIGGSCI